MELTGFEPRRTELARGIVIVRGARPLAAADQRALWQALSAVGVTEAELDDGDRDDDEPAPDRQWLAAPWLPPTSAELDAQRSALEQVAARYQIEAIWCVKVETGVDGVAWMELAPAEPDEPEPEPRAQVAAEGEVVDAIFERDEVLYAAPDAPAATDDDEDSGGGAGGDDDDEEEDDDDDDSDELDGGGIAESHWRNGAPPFEDEVAFPIERYPEVIDAGAWARFGVAVKLAGSALPGEESVINAFFALWLSVYQDERIDEFEPFERADVSHDRRHRSALMWVERFAVPATSSDQVHFLLWIIARIHDVLPIAWARFEPVDDAVRSRAVADAGGEPFILAGNPFAERFRRYGLDSALDWAVAQSAWTRRELAGMLIEVALEYDPDDPASVPLVERLLRRARAFDAASDSARYLAVVLVRTHRLVDAIVLARDERGPNVRLLVVGEIAERAPGELAAALDLLDDDTLVGTDPEELAELVTTVARHAPAYLVSLLALLPGDAALVRPLYNASFTVDRPQALAILRAVLALPEPGRDAGEARTALVMAWNNACIHAHALGDFGLAVELADGGQRFARENPYIFHSAACAYAASGELDRALEQVARAIEHDYVHAEKMETDLDLAPLRADPRFAALFVEWRTRRADLN